MRFGGHFSSWINDRHSHIYSHYFCFCFQWSVSGPGVSRFWCLIQRIRVRGVHRNCKMPRKFYSQANQQYRTDLLPRETGCILWYLVDENIVKMIGYFDSQVCIVEPFSTSHVLSHNAYDLNYTNYNPIIYGYKIINRRFSLNCPEDRVCFDAPILHTSLDKITPFISIYIYICLVMYLNRKYNWWLLREENLTLSFRVWCHVQ